MTGNLATHQAAAILHRALPPEMSTPRALPGVQPLDPGDWIRWDEVGPAQTAARARILAENRGAVLTVLPGAEPACEELVDLVSAQIAGGPWPAAAPAGASDAEGALAGLAHRVQEDFCILEQDGDTHVLTAGLLCFPASWMLSEKIGRPLVGIHDPVPEYAPVAHRVQRLFDGLQVGRPLWRFNRLAYHQPDLFQPRSELAPRDREDAAVNAGFLRCERQCLLRLPETRAVVFSIHTYVVAVASRGA